MSDVYIRKMKNVGYACRKNKKEIIVIRKKPKARLLFSYQFVFIVLTKYSNFIPIINVHFIIRKPRAHPTGYGPKFLRLAYIKNLKTKKENG